MVEEIKQENNLTLIEQAEAVAKRIEEANKRTEELLKRNEEVLSRSMLSGRSTAGTTAPAPIDPQIKLKEDMKQYFKGSAIEKLIK